MDTKSFHLRRQPAPEGILTGVGSEGEFHEISQPASEALLTGVIPTREIHLKKQCASEGILEGVNPKGEFHAPTRCDTYFVSCEKVNTGTDTDAVAGFGLDLIYHKNPGYKPEKPEYMP